MFRRKDIIPPLQHRKVSVSSMSQTQTRKQKILGEVKRKRRQRAFATLAIVIALIAIVAVAAVFVHVPPNKVPLPSYLSVCVSSSPYHYHPNLAVTINGAVMQIPVTFNSGCPQPIHTHDSSGILHVESDTNRDFTLNDWFLLWGNFENNPTIAILNSTQIWQYKVDATHHLTMTVNGQNYTSTAPQDYVFPKNAGTASAPCSVGNCLPDNIVLTYG